MDHFHYQNNQLYVEALPLENIVKTYGSPVYVYSKKTIVHHYQVFDQAFGEYPHLICYAVKANSNIAILQLLAQLGAGFDIVSKGELARVIHAGGNPQKVVFSGVGKTIDEMEYALEQNIRCFNIESLQELDTLQMVAKAHGVKAPVSFRVNPDVDAKTHPYIATGLKENKFGIAIEEALSAYQKAADYSHIKTYGVDCHIGSQLTSLDPFMAALERLLVLLEELKGQGIDLKHLDLGGGLGIRYHQEIPPLPHEWAASLLPLLKNYDYEILIEPGRAMVGNAGVLLTKVLYLKENTGKNFAIIDAAMNDLMRPSLYAAWHDILPLQPHIETEGKYYDLVGPICETGDFLAKERLLCLKPEDLLAVRSAGAYGFSMSSQYNSRPRVAEVLVDNKTMHLIRKRETIEDLYAHEVLING